MRLGFQCWYLTCATYCASPPRTHIGSTPSWNVEEEKNSFFLEHKGMLTHVACFRTLSMKDIMKDICCLGGIVLVLYGQEMDTVPCVLDILRIEKSFARALGGQLSLAMFELHWSQVREMYRLQRCFKLVTKRWLETLIGVIFNCSLALVLFQIFFILFSKFLRSTLFSFSSSSQNLLCPILNIITSFSPASPISCPL